MATQKRVLLSAVMLLIILLLGAMITGCNTPGEKSSGRLSAADGVLHTEIINSEHMTLTATTASDSTASVTLTARVAPAAAAEAGLTWEMYFTDPSSEWANGKTVTDYVTLNKETENALTATLTCIKPFGEQITVKVTSIYNPEYSAVCVLGFTKKANDVRFTLYYDGEELDSMLYSEMKAGTVESDYFEVSYHGQGESGYNARDWDIKINVAFTEEEKQYELKVEGIFGESYSKDHDFVILEYVGTDKYGDKYNGLSSNDTPDGYFTADAYVSEIMLEDDAQACVDKIRSWITKPDLTGFYADVEEYDSIYFKGTINITDGFEFNYFGDWRDIVSQVVVGLRTFENTHSSLSGDEQKVFLKALDSIYEGFTYMGEEITFGDETISVADYFYSHPANRKRIRYQGLESDFGVIFDFSLHFTPDSLPLSVTLDPSEIIF